MARIEMSTDAVALGFQENHRGRRWLVRRGWRAGPGGILLWGRLCQ
jgi:hypothetical protein